MQHVALLIAASAPLCRKSAESEFSEDLEGYLRKKLEEYLDRPPPSAGPEPKPELPPNSSPDPEGGADQKGASKDSTNAKGKEGGAPNDLKVKVKGKDDGDGDGGGGEGPPPDAEEEDEHDVRRQLSAEEKRQVAEWLEWVKTVVRVRRMVTLYSLHSEAGIDGSILEALFKSRTSSLPRQLELAIRFDRLDMARTHVLAADAGDHKAESPWKKLLKLKPRSPIGTCSKHGLDMLSHDNNHDKKVPPVYFMWSGVEWSTVQCVL